MPFALPGQTILGRAGRRIVVGGALGAAYDSASQAYFAAMSVQPDAARKTLLNGLIVGLKSDGVWPLLDYLSITAAHDAQAGRINARNPAQIATANGTIPFTTDRGYAPDGATGYLETGVADNAGGNYTQDSASLFAWINTAPPVNGDVLGLSASQNSRIRPFNGSASNSRANSTVAALLTVPDGLGLTTASRVDGSNASTYRNGSGISATSASLALTGSTFQVGRANGVFSTGRVAAFGFGGGLTPTQVAALYNRLNTYLTAVGGA